MTFKGTLYGYQSEEVEQLKSTRSRLVGNDPGTGKTYVGLALDQLNRAGDGNSKVTLPAYQKTLIVAPKSVLGVWDDHCMDLTEDDIFLIDTDKQPHKAREEFLKPLLDKRKAGYFICHWESLRLLEPRMTKKSLVFTHIIADEVHRAKNKKAQQTQALKRLQTWYKSGLSGTPADNKPQDLWSILNWLWPNYYTSYWAFVKAYLDYYTDDNGFRKIGGPNPDTIGLLRKEMAPWYVRRRKEDVLPDLPPKYYTRIWVNLGKQQRLAYDEMRTTMMAWVEDHREELEKNEPLVANAAIAQLVRLGQFAVGYMRLKLDDDGNIVMKRYKKVDKVTGEIEIVEKPVWEMTEPAAKVDALMDILGDRLEYDTDTGEWGGEQIVIFSRYRQAIDLIQQRVEAKGIPYSLFHGSVKGTDREKAKRDFQSGKSRLFLGTIKAGGVGLTLTAARTIIFIDRDWSPSINLQAEDRLHRIGQKDAVEVIDLMARNTVDLGQKQQLATKARHLAMLLGDIVLPDLVIADLEKEATAQGPKIQELLIAEADDDMNDETVGSKARDIVMKEENEDE
jgi:SNF2 family DNA or RNA helicase